MRKRGKQICSMVLTLAMLLAMMPIVAFAVEQDVLAAEKKPGLENVLSQEKLPKYKSLVVSTTEVTYAVENGELYFDKATGVVTDCDETVSIAVIPETIEGVAVTAIGEYAFARCENLTSVTIPDSVTSIGENAFYYRDSLTSVIIPDSITTIGDSIFYNCDSLSSVTIGNGVTHIGSEMFYNCKRLKQIIIPDSVTTIGDFAFFAARVWAM